MLITTYFKGTIMLTVITTISDYHSFPTEIAHGLLSSHEQQQKVFLLLN